MKTHQARHILESFFTDRLIRTRHKGLFLGFLVIGVVGQHTYAQVGGENGKGKWGEVIQMPIVSVAAANLPNGKVLTWSAYDRFAFGGNRGKTYTAVFDPQTNTSEELLIANTQHDMFCPGTSSLVDGRVIVTGGSSSNKTSIYNPFTNTWEQSSTMNTARGYHSMVTLADGSVFTIGGSWSGGRTGTKTGEIWKNGSWTAKSGLPGTLVWEGSVSEFSGFIWDSHAWLWPAPNGKLFHAGPSQKMHWIDMNGNGSYTDAGERQTDSHVIYGTIVMYDTGKLLKAGGNSNGQGIKGNTYVIDINTDRAQVKKVGDLKYPRGVHNSVVLPTGEVMVMGGNATGRGFTDDQSIFIPEMWSPETETWRELAELTVPRNYHSIALLLPDGRIFTAGGGLCGSCTANHPDAQVYNPSYLYNPDGTLASRPKIDYAPTRAKQGTKQIIKTREAVSYFSLVRFNSATHSTNNEQRRIQVDPQDLGENMYEISIPHENIAIPGYYMLFAVNRTGTPSVAATIQIDPSYVSAPKLFVKVKLEGAMENNSTLMRSSLLESGKLGHSDPFGLGETMASKLRLVRSKDAAVDWLRLQLRDKDDPTQIVSERAVLVQKDGDLMDAQGNSPITFPGIPAGSYYVAIDHVNHLGTMTSNPVQVAVSKWLNFSDPNTNTFSNGADPQKNVDGTMCLWAGDANGDRIINALDKNLYWRRENGQTYVYGNTKADFNLDGTVNAADLNLIWRLNNSRIGQIPR